MRVHSSTLVYPVAPINRTFLEKVVVRRWRGLSLQRIKNIFLRCGQRDYDAAPCQHNAWRHVPAARRGPPGLGRDYGGMRFVGVHHAERRRAQVVHPRSLWEEKLCATERQVERVEHPRRTAST